jgi:hypothetical protein
MMTWLPLALSLAFGVASAIAVLRCQKTNSKQQFIVAIICFLLGFAFFIWHAIINPPAPGLINQQ